MATMTKKQSVFRRAHIVVSCVRVRAARTSVQTRMRIAALCVLALVFVSALLAQPVLKLVFPLKYADAIEKNAARFNVDPFLVMGIISAESGFRADVSSHRNAKGLMQLKEDTAAWCVEQFGLSADAANLFDPETNITIGCSYLEYLIDLFYGDVETALAAYNAGLGNVRKWLSDPSYSDDGKSLKQIPFSETANYVKTVARRRAVYQNLYET